MCLSQIGQRFVEYYKNGEYQVIPRGSLLDPSVPMTFVGSAGLAQIETFSQYNTAYGGKHYVLLQPCFRHFDIDQVGCSPIHLSLFEMGGAFAFGDTDRETTLSLIWNFFEDELGIDTNHLWVTYFAGDTLGRQELAEDTKTRQAWSRLGVPDTRQVGVGLDGGFWRQGGGLDGESRLRKCGFTSEIYYDRGVEWQCGPACGPNCRCGRFIEVANVLFIHTHYDRQVGTFVPLKTPFDETVIGIERVGLILENKASMFQLNDFEFLIELLRNTDKEQQADLSDEVVHSLGIIADHVRALLFLVADGAPPPGKGGRARIIRSLIRGVFTHQRVACRPDLSFVAILVDRLIDLLGPTYPHLGAGRDQLIGYFVMEQTRFNHTLVTAHRKLDRMVSANSYNCLTGQQILHLVKNEGLPLALLESTLRLRGIHYDVQEYQSIYHVWRRDHVL